MAESFSQTTRIGKLHPPSGITDLSLLRVDGTDGIDDLFELRVQAISLRGGINLDDCLGKHFSVELETVAYGPKWYDGILTEADYISSMAGEHVYSLVLRPWTWLAGLARNQRIFHEMNVREIVEQVLAAYGGDLEFNPGNLPRLEYTVQFDETDLDFVRRLLARHGISFHFEAQQGKHTMVMCDGPDHRPWVAKKSRYLIETTGQHVASEEHFESFDAHRRMTTGKVKLQDYDFKKSGAKMDVEQEGTAAYDNGKIAAYLYPGNYHALDDEGKIAATLLDQYRAADNRYTARGDMMSLGAGQKVEVKGESGNPAIGKTFLTTRASFSYTSQAYASGSGGGDSFDGSYEFVEADLPCGPPVIATRKLIHGIQTAKVVGSGDIDVDEHGRILVKFHWDQDGANSMRCRVAQSWAGANWGAIFTPRLGMEVVVQFVDGDPDRPLVTGCVYNDANKPPFGLPGEKNISGVKSNSTSGGGGYNELVFDDTKGKELIRQHAQFNMETTVENDEKRTIKGNRVTEITKDDTLKVGPNLTISAQQSIKLKCGSSEITMTPTTIQITSVEITVNGQASLTTKGTVVLHQAGASMDIKGPIVKINS